MTTGRDRKIQVEDGYDRIAESYLHSKDENDPATKEALEQLARLDTRGGQALDLGCGAGVPVTLYLARLGFEVTGVDISAHQLDLAARRVPGATLIKADMASVDFPPATFDAVVSFYAIIHVPREEHGALITRIARWLKPGGVFLATWPLTSWEGEEENWQGWGAPMWWSHYDRGTYLGLLQGAGFNIISADLHSDTEEWLWVLAAKPGSDETVA
jgi:cyclopropane fatty-acyl-phospholipid synthase-like methyltransferase